MSSFPTDLSYTADHEWLRSQGSAWRVGITQFAVDQLGDITLVDLPQSLIDNSPKGEVKLRVNQHFRVQPGAALTAKLLQVHATAKYVF